MTDPTPPDLQAIVEDKARKLLKDFEHQSATDQKNRAQAIEALCRAIGNLSTDSSVPAWAALLQSELEGGDRPSGPRRLDEDQP